MPLTIITTCSNRPAHHTGCVKSRMQPNGTEPPAAHAEDSHHGHIPRKPNPFISPPLPPPLAVYTTCKVHTDTISTTHTNQPLSLSPCIRQSQKGREVKWCIYIYIYIYIYTSPIYPLQIYLLLLQTLPPQASILNHIRVHYSTPPSLPNPPRTPLPPPLSALCSLRELCQPRLSWYPLQRCRERETGMPIETCVRKTDRSRKTDRQVYIGRQIDRS